ncbi:MAG: hypothetical protein GEU94_10690 [Micromonosporaceae bacterium]|nr:hypothetical protein [Micromonosporaceae bacterium]
MSSYPPYPPPQGQQWHGAAPQAATLSWPQIIGLSTWLVFPLLGCGCFGGAALIFIGAYARRKSWWIPGIGYTAVGAVSFVMVGASDPDSLATDLAAGVLLLSWFACIIHSCLINFLWVQFIATRRGESLHPAPQYYPTPAAADHWSGSPYSSAMPPGLAPDPQQYYGPGPSAAPVSAEPLSEHTFDAPAAPAHAAVASAETPLDMNTATAEQLATLPGFDAVRAGQVVAERQASNGFGSVQEFGAAAALAPHEVVRIRDLVWCAPSQPPPAPQPGRILDV